MYDLGCLTALAVARPAEAPCTRRVPRGYTCLLHVFGLAVCMPAGALNEKRLGFFLDRFESLRHDPEIPPFHYGSHYSSAGTVRKQPSNPWHAVFCF